MFIDQTSHDTFGILILGTHCVLKIRPRDPLGPSIKFICLAKILASHHHTSQPYRTVPYSTVPFEKRSVNENIWHKQDSNQRRDHLTLKTSRAPQVSSKSIEIALSILWAKSIEDDHLDTRILILWGRVSSKSIV